MYSVVISSWNEKKNYGDQKDCSGGRTSRLPLSLPGDSLSVYDVIISFFQVANYLSEKLI
jgi:hypothetical protein